MQRKIDKMARLFRLRTLPALWLLVLWLQPDTTHCITEEIEATPTNSNGMELGELSMPQYLLMMLIFLKFTLLYAMGILPLEIDLDKFIKDDYSDYDYGYNYYGQKEKKEGDDDEKYGENSEKKTSDSEEIKFVIKVVETDGYHSVENQAESLDHHESFKVIQQGLETGKESSYSSYAQNKKGKTSDFARRSLHQSSYTSYDHPSEQFRSKRSLINTKTPHHEMTSGSNFTIDSSIINNGSYINAIHRKKTGKESPANLPANTTRKAISGGIQPEQKLLWAGSDETSSTEDIPARSVDAYYRAYDQDRKKVSIFTLYK